MEPIREDAPLSASFGRVTTIPVRRTVRERAALRAPTRGLGHAPGRRNSVPPHSGQRAFPAGTQSSPSGTASTNVPQPVHISCMDGRPLWGHRAVVLSNATGSSVAAGPPNWAGDASARPRQRVGLFSASVSRSAVPSVARDDAHRNRLPATRAASAGGRRRSRARGESGRRVRPPPSPRGSARRSRPTSRCTR